MMSLTAQLLGVAEAYRKAEACELARVSQRALGDHRLLPRLASGVSSLTLRRADQALQWLSDHWPVSAAWPDGVPRPSSSLPSVPERRASQPNTDHPRGSEGPCPEAGSPASGPFVPAMEPA